MTDPGESWCDRHWHQLLATFDTGAPVNGILASVEVASVWLEARTRQLGQGMPRDAAGVEELRRGDAPLCCWLGEAVMDEVFARCVVPPRYRGLEPAVGHRLHLAELLEQRPGGEGG